MGRNVILKVNPAKSARFEILIRIPGWAREEPLPGDLYSFADKSGSDFSLKVNGQAAQYRLEKGYAVIGRRWKKNDSIELSLPMPVRRLSANPMVKDDEGRAAIQRGPVVYCAEWPDFPGKRVSNLLMKKDAPFNTEFLPGLLGGVTVVKGKAVAFELAGSDTVKAETDFTAIPYYAWANRGKGEMAVWFPSTRKN